ncbi:signal peptidase, endoplasmic reticulum-type [Halobacillus dabanensis]|uniref:Signal peptidase I n=2 Tax=Halobacillus dabanensis TaxID=240302 RepID=A0A1I3RLY3_HALDA|nr:signal peptidase I [Halobacillus dabanensis]SFJ47248.1 signal peptidase, endoplasmic reticulum-type [Halobacillus dabanensis]
MKNVLSTLMTFLLYGILIFMVVIVAVSKISGGESTFMGYQLKTVLSGSMEPTFQTGSIVAIEPTDDGTQYKKGDVITFLREEGVLVTHRIIEVKGSGENTSYVTKGDNNDGADLEPVLASNVVGKYVDFTVPYIGYVMDFANSKLGSLLLLVVPGVGLFGYGCISIWREISKLEDNKEKESAKA